MVHKTLPSNQLHAPSREPPSWIRRRPFPFLLTYYYWEKKFRPFYQLKSANLVLCFKSTGIASFCFFYIFFVSTFFRGEVILFLRRKTPKRKEKRSGRKGL